MSYRYQSTITSKNLSTPELLKQVCRPVLCVSSCRMKMQPHACYLIPCDPVFLYYLTPFYLPNIQFQHLSEGRFLIVSDIIAKKRICFTFLMFGMGEGVSKSIRGLFSNNRSGTLLFWNIIRRRLNNSAICGWIVGDIICASTDPEGSLLDDHLRMKLISRGQKDEKSQSTEHK